MNMTYSHFCQKKREIIIEQVDQGYGLYRLLRAMDPSCMVIVPSIPVGNGERIKTGSAGCVEVSAALQIYEDEFENNDNQLLCSSTIGRKRKIHS